MRRLLFVNHSGALGGAELCLLDAARHFGPAGCHVLLLADGPLRPRLEASGIGVTLLEADRRMLATRREAGMLRALAALPAIGGVALSLARIARGYDVIYANSQKAALVAMLVGPWIRRPVIWHLHDILSPDHFAPLQRIGMSRLANLAAKRVIANSAATRQSFIDCGGDAARAVVVPNGIDAGPFEVADGAEAAKLRASLGLGNEILVGLFGRISPWKGQHVLIDAMTRLPGIHAVFVGDALFGEAAYKQSLLDQAAAAGIADRLHWLGFRDDIPQLMRLVDVVAHCSTAPEPFGRVIVEGVMARRPLLASRHGASREILGDDYPWLVTPGDPAALASTIEAILAEAPARRAQLVARQFERAMALFSLPATMRRIEAAVEFAV